MIEAEFNQLGKRLTTALIEGDFALYQTVMRLPLRVTPKNAAPYVLRDDAALRTDFDLYHSAIQTQRITDIYRRVLAVNLAPDDEAVAQVLCEMNILRNAELVVEPFQSTFTMTLEDHTWKFSEILSPQGHIFWTLGRRDIQPNDDFNLPTPKQTLDAAARKPRKGD